MKGTSIPGGAFSLGATAEIYSSDSSSWRKGGRDPGGASLLIDAGSACTGSDVFVIVRACISVSLYANFSIDHLLNACTAYLGLP